MEENKQLICTRLLDALALTRAGSDCSMLLYEDMGQAGERVTIFYKAGGLKFIDVTADSGAAMIRDIMRAI